VSEVLFDGLMAQSDISQLLDELFGSLEGVSLDEAGEDVSAMLHEEGEWESADHSVLLAA
jgi:hypothetical protein